MRNVLRFLPACLLLAVGSGLTACESNPQRQVADNPHFIPPPAVDSTQYYAERDAYYSQHPEQGHSVVHHVYHNALFYTQRRRYYADPYSAYNDPHSHAYHREYEEERDYEAAHPEGGSKVATAAVAGATGLATGAAAAYYLSKKQTKNKPVSSPSVAALAAAPSGNRYAQATLVRNNDGTVSATKSPKLLTPVVKVSTTPAASFSKTPSPVFTVPAKSKPSPTASTSHSSPKPSSSPPKSRTFSFSKSRGGFFGKRSKR